MVAALQFLLVERVNRGRAAAARALCSAEHRPAQPLCWRRLGLPSLPPATTFKPPRPSSLVPPPVTPPPLSEAKRVRNPMGARALHPTRAEALSPSPAAHSAGKGEKAKDEKE